jgi:uncharacterized protein (DUF305 family)
MLITLPRPRLVAAAVLCAVAVLAASAIPAARAVAQTTATAGPIPGAPADVAFLSGMIVHHRQAILMAGWAPTHDAGPALRALCERILVSQRDEIATMTRWLTVHGAAPSDGSRSAGHAMAGMPGMDEATPMPGMLSPDQLAQLDAARGPAFDQLFLTFMIQHHQGALTMVDRLFGAQDAAQDPYVFQAASDISADQTAEIDRMRRMLAARPAR